MTNTTSQTRASIPDLLGPKRKRAAYSFLPRPLLLKPCASALRPFDFAVICAILSRARLVLDDKRHSAAFEAGALAIKAEKRLADEHDEAWRKTKSARRRGLHAQAPLRRHTFRLGDSYNADGPLGRTFEKAGKIRYRKTKRSLRKQPPPEFLKVELSRFALLRLARLSTDAKNLRHSDLVIDRLREAVPNIGLASPLLVTFRRLSSGRLRLWVSGEWLEPPFGKVPMPLPTRSPAAMALYLLVHTINTSPVNNRAMEFLQLCRRIGIDTNQPPSICRRAFNRALDIVNDHILRLKENTLRRHGIKPIAAYQAIPVKNGRYVRIVSMNRVDKVAVAEGLGDYQEAENFMDEQYRAKLEQAKSGWFG